MRAVWESRLARRILATTGIGGLSDWVTFAALVAVVAAATHGSVFAVALVTGARIVPSVVFGPLVAPYAGVFGPRRTLVLVDAARAAAIAMVAVAPGLAVVVAGLVVFEFAGALGSATREAAISAGVDPSTFESLNAATGVLSYGMLPVGGVVAAGLLAVHPRAPFTLAVAGYLLNAAIMGATRELDAQPRPQRSQVRATAGLRRLAAAGDLRDTVTAAVVGVVAIAMLFSVGTQMAGLLMGGPEAYGLLLGLLGAGGLAGAVAARRGVSATVGLATATVGSSALLGPRPLAIAGVVALGCGAGIAYIATQARLQRVARAPEEFAAAFAVIKVAMLLALVGAPSLQTVAGTRSVLAAMVAFSGAGALFYAARIDRTPLGLIVLRAIGRPILSAACSITVRGTLPAGGAVLVSNHPNPLDGVLAIWLDRRVRPIAKPQRHPLARAGFALTGTILTPGATPAAAEHLRRGGLVWLAPEGGLTSERLRPPRSGAARMALEAGAPIVPVAIRYPGVIGPLGSIGPRLVQWRPWRRPTVELVIGQSLAPDADLDAAGERYMAALAALLGVERGEHGLVAA